MDEPPEMTQSSQLLNELDASGLAPLKRLAFWTHLHENTVRDYRDGRIRHFGREMRFWNGVLIGLDREYAPSLPAILFRITGMLLQGTRLCVSGDVAPISISSLPAVMKVFAPMLSDLSGAMEATAAIAADGKVDWCDDPNIAELQIKLTRVIATALGINHAVARERQRAAAND